MPAEQTFTLTVNGQARTVTTDPDRPLLEVLREDLGLTGAKYGCGEGECGACTVLVEGQSVHSCLTPVAKVDRQSVLTIEGVAHGDELHPVQAAFLAEGGYQCGYCTPGMILEVVAVLNQKPPLASEQVRERFEGHLCRCCGYPKVLKAVQRAIDGR